MTYLYQRNKKISAKGEENGLQQPLASSFVSNEIWSDKAEVVPWWQSINIPSRQYKAIPLSSS